MSLYKYGRPEHVAGALKYGEIRIGTLSEYSDTEMDDARRDTREGRVEFVERRPLTTENNEVAALLAPRGIHGGHIRNDAPAGATFKLAEIADDAYIYSVSRSNSPELRHKFGGSGFRILDYDAFFNIITEELKNRGLIDDHQMALKDVVYLGTKENELHLRGGDPRVPIWRHKPESFEEELEVRAAWQPSARTPSGEKYSCLPKSLSSYGEHRRLPPPGLICCPEVVRYIEAL